MNVTVLQGINLESDMTTVVAQLSAVLPDLPNFFKQLHPIFMSDYSIVDGKTLKVQTHLPNLWKSEQFLTPIEDHAMGKISLKAAKTKMLEIVSIMISSMSTIPILQAAHEMGYETIQFYLNDGLLGKNLLNRYYTIGIGKEGIVTVSASSTGDSVLAFKTQRDKWITNQFLEEMDLPIAGWKHVKSKDDLRKIAQEIGFPLVIKPVGLTGGHAVFVGIETVEALEKAYDKIIEHVNAKQSLSDWQKEIIVQKKIVGDDYRVLVVGGKVEVATNRIPAQVTGDGTNTIRQLIVIENRNPARDLTLPTHTLKPIVIDSDLEAVIKKNGYSLDDVPPKDAVVQVRNVASMSQGGITADVTDKLNPQTKLICESIARTVHANVLGIDVLCKDISKPLSAENGSIIEMNTMPETYLNAFPVTGKQYPDIGKKIIRALIPAEVHTSRIVATGTISRNDLEKLITNEFSKEQHVGLLYENTMFIDGHLINDNLTTESAVLSLKKNKLLDAIVLHYRSVDEVMKNGFGFNEIDLMITEKKTRGPMRSRIAELRNSGKIHKLIEV